MKTAYTPFQFFKEWAGWGYHPQRETPAQGRARGARSLAAAEHWATKHGIGYAWSIDPDIDSSDFSDEKPVWALWQCVARTKEGKVVASLHGIDFGRDGGPSGDPYRRVVEAELAEETRGRA